MLKKNKNTTSGDPSGTIIDFRTQKKLHERRNTRAGWNVFVAVTLAAWTIALPTIGGALVGRWLDSRWPALFSWSLALMLLGAAIGCITAWRWGRH